MLQLDRTQGRSIPLLLCDSCGKRIVDGRDASVLYQSSSSSESDSQVLFAHNGSCKEELQESLGDDYVASDELSRYLADLARGVHLGAGD